MAEFKYCRNCGKQPEEAVVCVACGVGLVPKSGRPPERAAAQPGAKSKVAAGLLGIFLGWLGIHNFYLGFTSKAVTQLILGILGIVTFGVTTWISGIWGFVEGILALTGGIPADAEGKPLAD